jgi:hypothetical protein
MTIATCRSRYSPEAAARVEAQQLARAAAWIAEAQARETRQAVARESMYTTKG